MKLQFDSKQAYQLQAIQSVIGLFEGQHLNNSGLELSDNLSDNSSNKFTNTGVGNNLTISEEELLSNLNKVQTSNNLRADEISITLEKLRYKEVGERQDHNTDTTVTTSFPNFSVEMETGTGKTYVYLRTMYELNKIYGFKKFVIVVPSVAIREGVLKSLAITFDHFQGLYDYQPAEFKVYDSRRLTDLGNFAKSNEIQILVINIDSFAKDANVINQVRETGIKPIEYLQKSNPIVIIDEPQNMETDIRKRAISNLNPLFTLRYSATHKNLYNFIYKLDPVKAYDLGLVKQIEVDSIITKNDTSGAFISVDKVISKKQFIESKISIFVNDKGGAAKKQITAKIGDDLYNLSKGWDIYKEGYVINELNVEKGYIRFSSGLIVHQGEAVGGLTSEIMKAMVDATVENHFKKEKELKSKGIKVLSLFFIDRVANYRSYDDQDNSIKGKIAIWFEESFNKWKDMPAYRGLYTYNAEDVHDGYFSQDKGKYKDSKEGRSTKADDETYKLIMQDKERLLSNDTPLRFIFSHSALREGWDNPNVFQICTLNETKSDMKKRQEIGRGLRLCVNQNGERNLERSVNRLTVIANDSYEAFSKALQTEIEEDTGVKFEGRIKDARARKRVQLKENWSKDSLFLKLWDKIKYRSEYRIDYSTVELIKNCVSALQKMSVIEKPSIYREKNIATFIRDKDSNLVELGGEQGVSEGQVINDAHYDIPDIIAYIQSKTELTRDTITKILLGSNRMDEIFNNPQLFMDTVVKIVKDELDLIKLKSVHYNKLPSKFYDINLFEAAEKEYYSENLIEVKNQAKSIYNYVDINPLSSLERRFVEACETRDDILFYLKLPSSFRIETPVSSYDSGWLLIKKNAGEGINKCFVVQLKDIKATNERLLLADKAQMKLACAEKHFKAIGQIDFRLISSVDEL